MTNAPQIRLATSEHVEAVAELFDQYRVWYGEAPDRDRARSFISHRLANHESVIFLAHVSDQAVGFVQLYPLFSSISMEPIWLLNDLFVRSEFRSQNIGSLLLQTATEFARESGALRLELEAAGENSAAQAFYLAHGWQRETEFLRFTFQLND